MYVINDYLCKLQSMKKKWYEKQKPKKKKYANKRDGNERATAQCSLREELVGPIYVEIWLLLQNR